jgi:DNA-binding NarL/FixJ family response regulator
MMSSMTDETLSIASDSSTKKRILIVEDHPIFRHGLMELLERQPELTVCGQADSAPEALEQMRRLQPDLVILDITLRGTNGIELLKMMRAEKPHLPAVMLSMHDEVVYAIRALKAGALAYVMKADGPQPLLEAVNRALQGKLFVGPRLGEILILQAVHGPGTEAASPVDRLSDRELEVFTMVGRGHPTRSIAQELNLSVKTIETHRAHIKEKLGFADGNDLIRFAIEWVAQQELR